MPQTTRTELMKILRAQTEQQVWICDGTDMPGEKKHTFFFLSFFLSKCKIILFILFLFPTLALVRFPARRKQTLGHDQKLLNEMTQTSAREHCSRRQKEKIIYLFR